MKKLLLLSALLFSCGAIAQEQDAPAEDAPQQVAGGRWVYPTPIDERASDPETCRLKLDRYRQSEQCFQPYRYGGGRLRPGASEHCTEYPQPTECMTRP